MLEFLDLFTDGVVGNIVGGSNSSAVTMATLFLISLLVMVLLSARLGLEIALIIVSPAIIIASFAGLIPQLAFGVIVFILALFWAGIILAMIK